MLNYETVINSTIFRKLIANLIFNFIVFKKPFPWGDGDKSLFHNEKFNVGPDTDFEEEDEHSHHEQEVSYSFNLKHALILDLSMVFFLDDINLPL